MAIAVDPVTTSAEICNVNLFEEINALLNILKKEPFMLRV